jgi:hypothetical protein
MRAPASVLRQLAARPFPGTRALLALESTPSRRYMQRTQQMTKRQAAGARRQCQTTDQNDGATGARSARGRRVSRTPGHVGGLPRRPVRDPALAEALENGGHAGPLVWYVSRARRPRAIRGRDAPPRAQPRCWAERDIGEARPPPALASVRDRTSPWRPSRDPCNTGQSEPRMVPAPFRGLHPIEKSHSFRARPRCDPTRRRSPRSAARPARSPRPGSPPPARSATGGRNPDDVAANPSTRAPCFEPHPTGIPQQIVSTTSAAAMRYRWRRGASDRFDERRPEADIAVRAGAPAWRVATPREQARPVRPPRG